MALWANIMISAKQIVRIVFRLRRLQFLKGRTHDLSGTTVIEHVTPERRTESTSESFADRPQTYDADLCSPEFLGAHDRSR